MCWETGGSHWLGWKCLLAKGPRARHESESFDHPAQHTSPALGSPDRPSIDLLDFQKPMSFCIRVD